jgi:hypothetical protein
MRAIEEVALLRSVSVNLAELRRVFGIKYFWFMDEIVTDGVGQMRTYGPGGQVKGGRGPSVAPNPLRGECSKEELLTQRSLRMGRGAQKKGIKVGLDAKWVGFKVWI